MNPHSHCKVINLVELNQNLLIIFFSWEKISRDIKKRWPFRIFVSFLAIYQYMRTNITWNNAVLWLQGVDNYLWCLSFWQEMIFSSHVLSFAKITFKRRIVSLMTTVFSTLYLLSGPCTSECYSSAGTWKIQQESKGTRFLNSSSHHIIFYELNFLT